eukprot:354244-Chlamydomonas_euryale.AAC.5
METAHGCMRHMRACLELGGSRHVPEPLAHASLCACLSWVAWQEGWMDEGGGLLSGCACLLGGTSTWIHTCVCPDPHLRVPGSTLACAWNDTYVCPDPHLHAPGMTPTCARIHTCMRPE